MIRLAAWLLANRVPLLILADLTAALGAATLTAAILHSAHTATTAAAAATVAAVGTSTACRLWARYEVEQ